MLTISIEQMTDLAQARRSMLARALAERAMQRYPEACRGRSLAVIADEMMAEIDFAHALGFQNRSMLHRYADLSTTLGAGFGDREEWARAILGRRDLTPSDKLDALEETAAFVLLAR